MHCSNCGDNCSIPKLVPNTHCGETIYDNGDRVKVRNPKSNSWGTIRARDPKDGTYMIYMDDSEELEWFSKDDVSHLLNHELNKEEV